MWKILIFFCFPAQLLAGNIVSVKCGSNEILDDTETQFYSFEREIIEGSIEFTAMHNLKREGYINLYRGIGDASDLNKNVTLNVKFKTDKSIEFCSKKLNDQWTDVSSNNHSPLTFGKHRVKIEIFKDRYDINLNGVFIQSYKRVEDDGQMLKAASVGGEFWTTGIYLQCRI